MRKVSFALAVGFALIACGGGDETPPPKAPEAPPVATTPPPAPTAEAPKEEPKKESLGELQHKALRGTTEAWNAHDAKKVASFYTDNGVKKVVGMPDMVGRDAIEKGTQMTFDAFKDFAVAPSRVLYKGDVAIVEWAYTGTHTGDLMGVKASEKKTGVAGVDVVWFTPEGQIKELHSYFDMGTILSQVGASKQKARPAVDKVPPPPPQVVKSTDSPDEAKNADVVKAMTAAMDNKKEADFLATMADNVEWDDMTQPTTSKGKNDAKKFMKEFSTGFPDAKTTVANTWAMGDFVVTENSWTGTHKGSFFGMAPTKKNVTVKTVDVIQLKDGKVVKGTGYSNGADFAMQLGLMPKPGDAKAAPAGDKKPADKKPADKAPAKK